MIYSSLLYFFVLYFVFFEYKTLFYPPCNISNEIIIGVACYLCILLEKYGISVVTWCTSVGAYFGSVNAIFGRNESKLGY